MPNSLDRRYWLGQAIRHIRRFHGITQSPLAERGGWSVPTQSAIENGECWLSVVRAIDISEFLGITLDELVAVARALEAGETPQVPVRQDAVAWARGDVLTGAA